ncbi:MAG TPA: hypothetical protein VEF05_16510 [Terriglobales bacterium]|nr:hypothetical protein [Terriglobales bacterium]
MTFARRVRRYNLAMRQWLAVAALGAVFAVLPSWGQRRGGISGGFGGHAGIAARGPAGGMRGSAAGFHRPGFAGGVRVSARWGLGSRGGPFFRTRFHHHSWWGRGYGYPWGWGWWGYPWDYGDLGWYDNSSYAQPYYPQYDYANQYDGQNHQVQEQQAEIDRLNEEVERLREERRAERQPPAPEAKPQPTELVFRDKRTEEIQNYAIAGQTLWVLTGERARKIPLAELDIAATQKVNEDRGVDFEIPR